jgi:titin
MKKQLSTVVFVAALLALGPSGSRAQNPIVLENQNAGSTQWQISRSSTDAVGQIKGYASATSINKGDSITLYVSVNQAQTYSIDVYRMGWYEGTGGRLMYHVSALQGIQQATCPADPVTGTIVCSWTPSYTLAIPVTWTSGVYLALLTNTDGYQNYITFVVRDDSRIADVLYQQSATTLQAYNDWPNDGVTGKSVYDFNSYGPVTVTGTARAAKVSFDRPYKNDGAAEFTSWEIYMIQWLEMNGYDVAYSTDVDTHTNGARLLQFKAFLSVGHDEYWSKEMYDAAVAARDAGVGLGFFGADAVYWQIRFESSASGVPNRVMVCYKDATIDPVQGPTTTVLWRNPIINRPEQTLVGVQYSGNQDPPLFNYVVSNSSSWVYRNTGFIDGTVVPGIVGYEWDRYMPDFPAPPAVAGTWSLLSHSPTMSAYGADYGNSSIYQAKSGSWVFAAGTISWANGLAQPELLDPRLETATTNVMNALINRTMPPPDTTPPTIAGASSVVNNAVQIVFSEPLSEASALNAANYSMDNGVQILGASLSNDQVTVTLSTTTLAVGTTYTIFVSNIGDLSGNLIAPGSSVSFHLTQQITLSFQDKVSPISSYAGTRDTYISQSSPTSNFATSTTLKMDGDDPGGTGLDLATLIKWDISQIPYDSTVLAASITYNVTDPTDEKYEAYRLLRDWSETGATWNETGVGEPWAIAGAEGDTDRNAAVLATLSTGAATGSHTTPLNAAGVAAVQSWIASPSTNYGMIIADTASADGLWFNSREVSASAGPPILTITYALPQPPAAPDGLTATAIGSSQIHLAWNDNANNEDGYHIEQSADGASFSQIATVGADTTDYSDTGLVPGTQHYYRVRAFNSTATSAYSNVASATTVQIPPAAPSRLIAAPSGNSQVNLSWTDNSDNESGFKIERSIDGVNFFLLATVPPNLDDDVSTLVYQDSVPANGTYSYRVLAFNSAGNSNYSNIAVATTPQLPPTAPSGLIANSSGTSLVNLAWVDNSSNEDGFKLERSIDGVTYIQIAVVGANSFAYTDTGVAAATTYYYRVRAYNAVGNSDYSNLANATTQAPVVDTTPPYVIAAQTAVTTSVVVLFSKPLNSAAASASSNYTINNGVTVLGASLGTDGKTVTLSTGTMMSGVMYTLSVSNVMDLSGNVIPAGSQAQFTISGNATLAFQDGVSPTSAYAGTRDTYIAQATTISTKNYGKVTVVEVDASDDSYSKQLAALMKWDLSFIPSSAIVQSASIKVNVTNNTAQTFAAYQVLRSWDELTATWINASTGNPWQAPGLTGTADRGTTSLATFGPAALGAYTVNLNAAGVAAVQAWVNNPAGNFGIMVWSATSGDGLWWSSREDTTVANHPILSVTYTVITPPAAPSALVATATSTSQINLTWTDNAANESGFNIERSPDGTNFVQITSVAANATSYSDLSVSSGATYYYRVRSFNTGANSNYSNVASSSTALPGAPSGLRAIAASESQVNLSWNEGSGNEAGFDIERSLDGVVFVQIGIVPTDSISFTDVGLTENRTYYYRIVAFNNLGRSPSSNVAQVTTPEPPPAVPGGLTATAQASSQISLSWFDAQFEDGFMVERSPDGVSGFTQVAIIPASGNVGETYDRVYTDITLSPGTQYCYRVRSYNTGGDSAYSNVSCATTVQVLPAGPSSLVASTLSSISVSLAWVDNSNNESKFVVERSPDGVFFSPVAYLPANSTAYIDGGVSPSGIYYYRVKATNSAGDSPYSNVAAATTPPPPPPAPSGLGATVNGSSAITLLWVGNGINLTGFEVARSTDGAAFTVIADLPATVLTYSDTSLTPSTLYYYEVRAVSAGGTSGYSTVASATTAGVPPAAPTSMIAAAVGDTAIDLNWGDNSDNEDGFIIERSLDGVSFTQIATMSPNVTAFSDTGLNTSTLYYYRVAAYNTWGNSAYANVVNATTGQGTPSAPGNLAAVANGSTEIDLDWSAGSANEDGFKIERSPDGVVFAQIATVAAGISVYSDQSLNPGSTYYYRVRAYNAAGDSSFSNVISATTAQVPPAAPASLTATASGSSQVNLSWSESSTGVQGFNVERSPDGVSFTPLATLPGTANSYNDSGLSPANIYYYRVLAFNAVGQSDYSGMANATTAQIPPAAPAVLTATAEGSAEVQLGWTDQSNNEDGFKIERSNDGTSFAPLVTLGVDTTSYLDTGLTPATTYYYRVHAYNVAGDSGYSNTASAATGQVPPPAPTNLTATAVSSGQVNLAWTDNASNEDGFRIERSTDGVTFTEVTTVAANAVSYADTSVSPAATYYYRVRAYNSAGDSDYTNVSSATTPDVSPIAPSHLVATAISISRIDLSWTDNSANETGFQILRSTDGINFAPLTTLAANSTGYSDTGLSSGTTYYYQVRAFNSAGNSAVSNVSSATTPIPQPPGAPSALAAISVSTGEIDLSWIYTAADATGFYVERSTDGVTFAQIATVAAHSYNDTGLAPGALYYYRARGYNDVGASPYSNIASAATQGATATFKANVLADNPVGYWRLDETSGTRAADTMGKNPGTYTGGYTLAQTGAIPSDADTAVLFDGTTGYVSAANSTSLTLTDGPLTLEAWVKRGASNHTDVIIHKGTGAYQLRFNASNRLTLAKANTADIASSTAAITDTNWHHCVATKNGSSVHLYLDGVDVTGTVTNQTLVNATGSTLRLGTDSNTWLKGTLDEVAIYTVVLSPQRVRAHYAAGLLPLAPNSLAAVAVSNSQVNLTWSNNAANATGIYIERSTDGVNFLQIAAVGNVSAYSDSTLTPVTTYYYRLRSYNASGTSSYSNVATATTSQ